MRRAAIFFVLSSLLGALLGGCSILYPPTLTVTPTSFSLTTTGPQPVLTIGNTNLAPSSLSWTAASSDPRITLHPSHGTGVSASSPQRVAVLVDASTMSLGQTIDATITITSNGGSRSVPLHFLLTATTASDCTVSTFALRPASLGKASPATPSAPAFVPNQVIVGFLAPKPQAASAQPGSQATAVPLQVASEYGLRVLRSGGPDGPSLLEASDVSGAMQALKNDPRVRYVQRNYYVHLLRAPTDPCYQPRQWNLKDFGLPEAWDIESGSSNPVVVAIIDSGVQADHPDLRDKLLPGWNFYDDTSDTNPGPGVNHGTHVAGIAAAMGDNLAGVAGVAFGPKAQILPVRVFDDTGQSATTFAVADAIRWAAGLPVAGAPTNHHPAQVINLSIGVAGDQQVLDQAALDAWNAGALLVAASGNSSALTVESPANAPSVIAVGSVNDDYHVSSFSNGGPDLEVVAPGGFDAIGTGTCPFSYSPYTDAILSTYAASDYGCEAGTSMASPFVAGVAALLKSHHPSWSPAQLRNAIDTGTLFDGTFMDAAHYGNGIVCADKALGAATTCGQ